MNWKIKAFIQNACAALPLFREEAYFGIQKMAGDVANKPDPIDMMEAAADLAGLLQKAGTPLAGARVFEVGTGRRIDMPLGLFLAGAASVTTFDLHRYLKPELVLACVQRIRENRPKIRAFFAPVTDPDAFDKRLDTLLTASGFDDLAAKAHVFYRAPADAAATGLPAGSVDIHLSYTVFEHIPGPVLEAILREAARLLSDSGVALHHIDLSDHFAQTGEITKINFLQYSDAQWKRYAGNQFAYHNRLRPHDFRAIYQAAGHEIRQWIPSVDRESIAAIQNGFPLHSSYRTQSPEELCTGVLRVLSRAPANSSKAPARP